MGDLKYRRTKKGMVTATYRNQKNACKRRGHRPPDYTKEELKDWLFSQKLFHKLYNEWVMSGYKKHSRPSVDRKNDDIHYCFGNIQLMTWAENEQKAHDDMRDGKLKHGTKPQKEIEQYTMGFEMVATFVSTRDAERRTGIGQGTISSCASDDGQLSAGGYRWKFVEDGTFEDWKSSFKSDAERRVLRTSNKGVDMLTMESEYICSYPSMAIAAELNGLNRGNISNCVKGRCNSSGGYKWRLSDVER